MNPAIKTAINIVGSQKKLGAACEVSQQAVYKWLHNKAKVTGATVTSINQAAAKMARTGILVIDGKVWRTVYYRFATREEREGKVSTNLIFKECRQSAAMKRVLAFYRGNFQ